MYKFRSMYTGDNDKRLRENYPELWKKYKDAGWKLPMSEDPRITPIGKIIRSTSIDEFPQLFNVLKGEMSLVGPRPIVQDELPRYGSDAIAYLRVRPGLTGLWQTTGRNDVSYDERVNMDVAYERNISFTEDLRIMVMTIVTMLRRTGK